MGTTFLILAGVAMALVLASLFIGLGAMVRGGEFNRLYGNKLMRLRVLFQGLAILFLVVAFMAG